MLSQSNQDPESREEPRKLMARLNMGSATAKDVVRALSIDVSQRQSTSFREASVP